MIVVQRGTSVLLLDCRFDEQADEYSDWYEVYEMPAETSFAVAFVADWTVPPARGRSLGRMPVGEVRFDSTRRKSILASSLAPLIPEANTRGPKAP